MKISAGGVLIVDFDYNRTHPMFQIIQSVHNRDTEDIESFGHRSDTVPPSATPRGSAHTAADTLPGIAGGSKQTIGFKLCSGLLNQPKM